MEAEPLVELARLSERTESHGRRLDTLEGMLGRLLLLAAVSGVGAGGGGALLIQWLSRGIGP